jgi:predicted transcriptional regulator
MPGNTSGMKTTVSIPDDLFESAEQLARRQRRSRSDLYTDAVREYVDRHLPDETTDALSKVVADAGGGLGWTVPAPAWWDETSTGDPMPDWVDVIRQHRAEH